jgi:hypothetical protein
VTHSLSVDLTGNGSLYWTGPVPQGWQLLGTVCLDGETSALLRTPIGVYLAGLCRTTRGLPQLLVRHLVTVAEGRLQS